VARVIEVALLLLLQMAIDPAPQLAHFVRVLLLLPGKRSRFVVDRSGHLSPLGLQTLTRALALLLGVLRLL
jgi:hypothetical protein